MKLDVIIHNNTAAVGLVYISSRYEAPLVDFVYTFDERIPESMNDFIHSDVSQFSKFDKELTIYLKNKYKAGDMIRPEDFRQIAELYGSLAKKGLVIKKKENVQNI